MIRVNITIAHGGDTAISDGEVTYEFQGGSYETLRLANGDPAVIAPNGIRVNTLPEKGMIGAPVQRLGNGARTNPDITGSTNVAFDHGVQFGGNPNGGLTEDMIVPAGHTVLKSVGMETGVAVGSSDDDRNRKGVMKQWSVLHVLPARPPADSVMPAIWAGDNRPWDQFDIDGMLGDLPSYPAAGGEVSWDDLRPRFDHRDIGAAVGAASATPPCYEQLMIQGTGMDGNYGRWTGVTYDWVMMGLLSDTWSDTDKAEALWRAAQIGYDNLMAAHSRWGYFGSNGGHFQYDAAFKLLAIKATGRLSQYAEFAPCMGNQFYQPFFHTEETVSGLQPHDDPLKPYLSRRRNFIGFDGADENGNPNILVQGYIPDGGSTEDTAANGSFRQGILVRERDGATATILQGRGPRDSTVPKGLWRFTLDQLPEGTTTSDRFWVKAPFPVTVGMPDWRVGAGGPNLINPLGSTEYREINAWTMRHRFARAFGMIGPQLAAWDQYTLLANAGTNSGWPDLIESQSRAFIEAHSAAILKIPQVV